LRGRVFVLPIFLSLVLVTCIQASNSQTSPKSTAKQIVIHGENNKAPYFFPSEHLFDLTCRVMAAGKVSAADAEAMRDGMIEIDSGTQAVEISRVNRFKQVGNEWLGKVRVRLASGPHKGKQGYVFAKWVFPVKGKAQAKTMNYSLVNIYDTNQNFTFMCKSRGVFDLVVRGTAGEKLTHEQQGVIVRGVYKLTRRTRARLISSKDNIPTPDGRYVGYSYVELIDGPYKGKRGFVFIDHVHK
jgi:hypothetical protein